MTHDDKRTAFLIRLGREIREFREAAGLSQQAVSDVFGWGRDAMSKIETGKNNLAVYEYLQIMEFLRHKANHHPAVMLARRLLHDK